MPQLRTIGYAIYSFCLCLFVFGGYVPMVHFLGAGQAYETVIEVPQPLDSFITEEELEALYHQVAKNGEEEGADKSTEEADAEGGDEGSDADNAPLAQKPTKTKEEQLAPELAAAASDAASTTAENSPAASSSGGGKGKGTGSGTGTDQKRSPPPKKQEASQRDCSSNIKGVQEVAENRYVIPAAVVDTYVNDLQKAERLAVVDWAMKNGKKEGVKIKRIRCRSVLKDAGFKNGDVILEVNNTPVDSYPKVLRAYLKVKRTDNRLTVKIRRNGKVLTMRYRLT